MTVFCVKCGSVSDRGMIQLCRSCSGQPLGHVQEAVLGLLTVHSGISASEIAEELGRSVGQVRQTITRLEDLGLVSRPRG